MDSANAAIAVCFHPRIAGELLEFQEKVERRLSVAALDLLNLVGKVEAEEERGEPPDAVANGGEIADDLTAKPRPDRDESERVARSLHLRAFVEVGEKGH